MERKSHQERQAEIKRAILEIISTQGLPALTTRQLARRVGVSEGALFRHFRNKRDMLLGILDDVQEHLVEPLRGIALSQENPEQRLFRFLCTHVSFLIEHKGITILLFSEATHLNDKELKGRLEHILMRMKQSVQKIIQDGIVLGIWDEAVNVESVATLYMGIPIVLNIEMVLNAENMNWQNFCQRMFELLLRVLEKK
ncbi:MAG: TetR/AcrR family transcriptional regulator [Calditrichaeota bacterium]|nr:MAG: TetR/AcrR family transcriptional regulator [Calditrichota bacterium]